VDNLVGSTVNAATAAAKVSDHRHKRERERERSDGDGDTKERATYLCFYLIVDAFLAAIVGVRELRRYAKRDW